MQLNSPRPSSFLHLTNSRIILYGREIPGGLRRIGLVDPANEGRKRELKTAMTRVDPVSMLSDSVRVPFENARAMPPIVYTSEEFLDRETRDIFAKEWICVGRSSSLADPGDYLTYELAGQPILVVRGRDGRLNAMSNVCLHRMSTILHGSGNVRLLSCPYHGWTYNLDGSLRGAPAMGNNRGFCKQSYKLPRIRCEEWLGWIMVTLDENASPVSQRLAEIESLVADFQMAEYLEAFNENFLWNTNWKVLAENFMESYHLPVCHAATIGGHSKMDEAVCPPGRPAFNFHTILKDGSLPISVAHPKNDELVGDRRRTTYLLSIYPSLLITLTPGYFWYLSLHPNGVGQVRILFGGGLAREFFGNPDSDRQVSELKELLIDVNEEDRKCTERVYKGLCADLARPGHISHLERPNFLFAQYLAEKVGGFERQFD